LAARPLAMAAAVRSAAVVHAITQEAARKRNQENDVPLTPAMGRRDLTGAPSSAPTTGGASSKALPPAKYILPHQKRVQDTYASASCQKAVAALIILNFCTNIVEKEIDPPMGEMYRSTWQALEDVFNIIFLIELIVNFYGNFFVPFWRSGWNIFDFIVVTVGICSLLRIDLGPLSLLRMLRAFRVFRLFKRIKSLNRIIVSLGKAIPGVTNAFVIMLIVMCIYAILAVEFFADFGDSGTYTVHTLNGETAEIDSTTARGYHYGTEYFGSFSCSLYTLWQVLTGESWSEAVARPLLFGSNSAGVGLFFTSFLIVTQIVLVNVVVAVLLEKMVEPEEAEPPMEEDSALAPDGLRLEDLPLDAAPAAAPAAAGSSRPAGPLGARPPRLSTEGATSAAPDTAAIQAELHRLSEQFDAMQELLKAIAGAHGLPMQLRNGSPLPQPKADAAAASELRDVEC